MQRERLAQLTLLTAAALAAVAGFAITPEHTATAALIAAGPELARLLRGMALIKTLMASAVAALVFWRLQFPATTIRTTAYIAATAAMAIGPGLVWGLAHIILGATLLHIGLIAVVLLGWRDEVSATILTRATKRAPTSIPSGHKAAA